MNKMYLVLGDWSGDGHGISEKVILMSDGTVKEIQDAYKNSCKLTGVSFNHNEDFTEKEYDFQEEGDFQIACEYELTKIPIKAFEKLQSFGLNKDLLCVFDPESHDNENYLYLSQEAFVNLWIWFVKLSDPKLNIIVIEDDIPCINGYWNDNLNVQFGYGLFSR